MRKDHRWDTEQIPGMRGRVVVVTGANSGLGFHTTRNLAMKGAEVILACRDLEKGEAAKREIEKSGITGLARVWKLDLADLDSVRTFGSKFLDTYDRLHLLINNAGLMATPYRRTAQDFEMQFGVNHLGHFVLTATLWPAIVATEGARVVTAGSSAHHFGKIRFTDIHWENGYRKWGAYGMSKLANLLFTRELANRILASGFDVLSVAAHPGYANTNLQVKGVNRIKVALFGLANRLVAQSAEKGALSTLYAATAADVGQGTYYGPHGFMRLTGWPAPDRPNEKRVTDESATRLWELSESLTGCKFPVV